MKTGWPKFLTLLLMTLPLPLCAQVKKPSETNPFVHDDWELVCDNTRTCRAAGYQSESDPNETPVSVLLTRKAGPREPVSGELTLGVDGLGDLADKPPQNFKVTMRVNGQNLGQIRIDTKTFAAKLSPKQVEALLAALPRKSSIEWIADAYQWNLSDKGAAAVLLKMDDIQGRVGTPGALIKKGQKNEDSVVAPLPIPVVVAAPLAKARPGDAALVKKNSKVIGDALRASLQDDDCPNLTEDKGGKLELSVVRLTEGKLLVSTSCWAAAYNSGDGYWVINDMPPYAPALVTASGTDFDRDKITSTQKGRGIGDCLNNESWTWNGKQFIYTESASSGMCRMVAPGGAWSLPTLTTDVRRSAPVKP